MEILYSGVSWFDYTSCELLVLASLHPFETSVSDYGVTKTMTHLERHFSFEQNIYCMRSKKLKHCLVHSYFYFADISFVYLERICPYGEKYLGTGYYIFHCNFTVLRDTAHFIHKIPMIIVMSSNVELCVPERMMMRM